MARRLLVAWMSSVVSAALAVPAGAAEPHRGACGSGAASPSCAFTYGQVVFVADGDTIDVDIPGSGVRRVRLTGVNATELTRYSRDPAGRRGECHAVEATERLENLLRRGGGAVRLAAQDPASMAGRRLRRQVSTRIDGAWVDSGRALIADGLALWLPNGVEWAWNRDYREASLATAGRGTGLFDSRACGAGPAAGIRPGLELTWDAAGDDGRNVAGEQARISNPSTRSLELGGWWFRDSSARRFILPEGASVAPGESLTVHVGDGEDDDDDLHWGLSGPVFENTGGGRRSMGDGGYLFDPRGNLRAWVIYPGEGDGPLPEWRPRRWLDAAILVAVALAVAVAAIRRWA